MKNQKHPRMPAILAATLIVAGLTAASASGPETILLDKGLAVALPEGTCRMPYAEDPIESALVRGEWRAPVQGAQVRFTGNPPAAWEEVRADGQGWIENKALACGYVYFDVFSDRERTVLLEGMSHDWVYVNGEPRIGNRYQRIEKYESWQPRFDFSLLPVKLKAGKNGFLFKCARGRLKAVLHPAAKSVLINAKDATAPDLVAGKDIHDWAAVVVINATDRPLKGWSISASGPGLETTETSVPVIQPLSVRKVGFMVRGPAIPHPGETVVGLRLVERSSAGSREIDAASLPLRVVARGEARKQTFVSRIDGSVQHFAINPSRGPGNKPAALFLSVHGANVEALNQVRAYSPKKWGHIVAPTNRRPYGFNWEDWGRMDALEVLDAVLREYDIDPDRVYLTGHSMGGHGTWLLGALFPELFGAIGPSAGWITFWSYKVRHAFENPSPMERMLMRPNLASDTFALARNYGQLGVYAIHGEKDDDVPVDESRSMAQTLAPFHRDFVYHEQSGAGHWWDISPEAGTDCVDWAPLFDFFARHARSGKDKIREIDFSTPCPGISASCHWLTIEAQTAPLKLSRARIRSLPAESRFAGSTENVARLSLDTAAIEKGTRLSVELDGQVIEGIPWPEETGKIWLKKNEGTWEISGKPSPSEKGPSRGGLFKDAFKNRMIFVYGTGGNPQENRWSAAKARYDAETFWYQGNGSVDVVPDFEFDPGADPDRNVILYGNAETNSAWKRLLRGCPVQVGRKGVRIGSRRFAGKNIGCLFLYPRAGSGVASVGAVSGTGIEGMRLTNTIPYLYPGNGYPDCLVMDSAPPAQGSRGFLAAGFFGNDWSVESGDFVWNR